MKATRKDAGKSTKASTPERNAARAPKPKKGAPKGGVIVAAPRKVALKPARAKRKAAEHDLDDLLAQVTAINRSQAVIEFDLDGAADPAAEAKAMCETLLANTVIESYRIEVA